MTMDKTKPNDQGFIKVIWMDDNPSKKIGTEFLEAGIEPKTFAMAAEAVREYQIHRGTYQAIILDMEGADGTVDEFSKAVKEFEPFLKKDLIPLYVLTNYTVNDIQYKLARGTIASFKIKDDVFYHKQLHLRDLIERIKKDVVNESEWFRVYKKYEEAFGAFESGIFDIGYQESLYKIVLCVSGKSSDFTGLFNEMRKFYEMVFYKFMIHKLPAEYYYGKNEISYQLPSELPMDVKRTVTDFLKGNVILVRRRDANVLERIRINEGPVLPLVMADILDRLMDILNTNSHYNPDPGKYLTNKDLNEKLPHFFESTALVLIDLIIWAKNEIWDKTRYSFHRIMPPDDNDKEKPDYHPDVDLKQESLKADETRIEVRVTQNIRNRERPKVRSIEAPGVFMIYNRSQNIKELIEWLEKNPDEKISAIVKNAYEVVKFEF